jgi:hypothetical protein
MALGFLEDICVWYFVRFNETPSFQKPRQRQVAELSGAQILAM